MTKNRFVVFGMLSIAGAALLSGCGKGGPVTAQGSFPVISAPNGAQVACIPLNQTIPYFGTGVAIDATYNLQGGVIPGASTYGSLNIGSGAPAGGTTFSNTNQNNVGTIQISVQALAASTTTAVSGSITLSPGAQQSVQSQFAASYNTNQGSGFCVSGIAIQGPLSASGNIFGAGYGTLYLYLNGTTHGVALPF